MNIPGQLPVVFCDRYPEWVRLYQLAWKLAFANMETPAQPGWKPQLTCMPGAGIVWQWDSCLMTFFARYSNGQLPGMNNLDNLYRLQRDDGYMSMAYVIATGQPAYGERINPPLLAWAEWEYFRATGDDSRLGGVVPRLVRYYDWIAAHRSYPSGLFWFEEPGASGMDNSPRGGFAGEPPNGGSVAYIDLASQQALSALCLSRLAARLGDDALRRRFEAEHRSVCERIGRHHWCDRLGIYLDVFESYPNRGSFNFLNHKTLASFWPLVAEAAGESQAARLVEHLANPAEFWTPHPLPTLSRDDPNYDPLGRYWLGGVWAPTNYMVVKGLEKYNRRDLARAIAERHLNAMCAVLADENYATIWECYSPELARPATKYGGGPVRPDFVGWSGLGPIAMLIEQVFGIDLDAPANRISWTVATPGRHGIENLRFHGRVVSLTGEEGEVGVGRRRVRVKTDGPVELALAAPGRREQVYKLSSGDHALELGGC